MSSISLNSFLINPSIQTNITSIKLNPFFVNKFVVVIIFYKFILYKFKKSGNTTFKKLSFYLLNFKSFLKNSILLKLILKLLILTLSLWLLNVGRIGSILGLMISWDWFLMKDKI